MLLTNSMTCAGNLIGFNSGGYKDLFHFLNIQVLFTGAIIFTPRRCFERSAEKCYDDFLSSIFASCFGIIFTLHGLMSYGIEKRLDLI